MKPLVFHWVRVTKNFMLQTVMSRFSVEIFLSHSTKTFRRGTHLCCNSEIFWWRKSLWSRRGKGIIQSFRRNFFCLTVPQLFVEEPFCAVLQRVSGGEQVYGIEVGRGSTEFFPSEVFCLNVLNYSVEEHF